MAAAHRTIGGEQRQACEREIAHHVQRLVAGAFVAVAQPFAVEQARVVEHYRILERGTQRETGAPKPRHVVHAAEGTGAGNLAAEALRAEIEGIFLAANYGVGEVDFDLGAETGCIGPQLAEAIPHRHLHRLQNLDETAWRRLRNNPRLVNRGDKGSGAAVHVRNFRTVDFDGGVIDAHAAQCGQYVFRG